LESADKSFTICVDGSHEELKELDRQRWRFDISKDLRVAALASLIKAAHLSIFSLLGYHYVLSSAGIFMGHDILGRFYLENRGLTKSEIVNNAVGFFDEFRNMVCPLAGAIEAILGTLSDGETLLCASSSGAPWGMIVFVKTAQIRKGVTTACQCPANLTDVCLPRS
jgi:hypothetical protein